MIFIALQDVVQRAEEWRWDVWLTRIASYSGAGDFGMCPPNPRVHSEGTSTPYQILSGTPPSCVYLNWEKSGPESSLDEAAGKFV
jgi:hypothetical protein